MKSLQQLPKIIKGREFFFKYFSSYLLIFSIPLFLSFFTYKAATDIISSQCDRQVQNVLQQTKDITDTRLQELCSISLTLKDNEHIKNFHREWAIPYSQGSIIAAYKACHRIPKYEVINSAIENTRIFVSKPDCCFILGTNHAIRYTDTLNIRYLDDTSMSYYDLSRYLEEQTFYEQFLTVPSSDTRTQNVYFLSNLNTYHQDSYNAVILIKLSNRFFSDMLQKTTLNNNGISFILTENHELISCYEGNQSFELTEQKLEELLTICEQNPENNFVFEGNQVNLIRSDINGWIYCSMIPQAVIIQDLTALRRLIFSVTFLTILAGLFICTRFTRRQSKPLKNMINSLTSIYEQGYFDSSDHFMFLENAVTDLIDKNNTYQKLYDKEILRQLFLDEHIVSVNFEKKLSQSSIILNDNLYITGYLHIHNLKKTELLPPALLAQRLKDTYAGNIYLLAIDEYNMILLAIHNDTLAESAFPIYLKETLNTLGNQILAETNCHVDFYISEPMRHYENVPKCYEQCKRLALNVYKNSNVFVYTSDDLPAYQQIYRYTIDQEIQLIQLIQHGSEQKLRSFLDDLYKENFESLILSEGMKLDLIKAIQKSVLRGLGGYQKDKKIAQLFTEINREHIFEELQILLFQLREAVHTHLSELTKSDSDRTKQSILDYIQNNYSNNALTLYSACHELKISEQTATKFFQELGSSFSAYLEKVRIENACDLLLKSDLTIKTISEKTGYSSDVSFRRAFKRVLGVSPSEFIKNNHAETNN